MSELAADSGASRYLRSTFQPNDRVALLLIHRGNGAVIQRIGAVDKIASDTTQRWLGRKNGDGFDVYIGMNSLKAEAHGRTKADIAQVRHLYLDIDRHAEGVLKRLNEQPVMPSPNHLVRTSPGKLQVVWKVQGFSLEMAENLQRQLARDFGADVAATDAARVLRLPGFVNHKYDPPHAVGLETKHDRTYQPTEFPAIRPVKLRQRLNRSSRAVRSGRSGDLSQSERDWADTKRRLWSGESEESIIEQLTNARKHDKWNPRDYAERTVRRAAHALNAEASRLRGRMER